MEYEKPSIEGFNIGLPEEAHSFSDDEFNELKDVESTVKKLTD